jgi:hypothetical protein
MYTAVPQNVCLVRDLWVYGVFLDTVADRLQLLQLLSMAAGEMAAIETAFLNAQWGLLHFHAHELRANLCYLCANDTVASLAAVITAVRNEPTPPSMLPFVDAAGRAFGVFEAWIVAHVWKLEANSKIRGL